MKKIITIAILCLLALGAFAQSTNTFEYDNLNRLTKVTYANGAVVQYQYDNVGNRISKTVSGVYTQYTITASANPTEGGTVSGGGTYNDGTTCTVTATANMGYTFVNWTENGTQVSTEANYTFTVSGDRNLVANFALPFTITANVTPSEGGTVTGAGTYNYGSTCTMTATPNQGYLFLNWSRNGEVVCVTASYSFTVTESVDLVASFLLLNGTLVGSGEATNVYLPSYSYYNYTLSQQIYSSNEVGEAGNITSLSFYNAGTEKTRSYDIYMVHTDKTSFESNTDWIAVSESDLVYSGNVTMARGCWTTIVLNTGFDYNGTSNLAIIVDDNTGTWSSNHMSCRVFDASGNQAIRVYSDGTNYDPYNPSSYNGTLHSVKNQIIINKSTYYNIIAQSSNADAGSVSGSGWYPSGSTCTLTATANSGYTFTNWTENGNQVSTDATYSFTVTNNRTLVANFTSTSLLSSLSDDFNDGEINSALWTYRGSSVYEADGLMKIEQNVTDADVRLTTLPMSLTASGQIVMERSFMVHRTCDYFSGGFAINFNGVEDEASNIRVAYWYENYANKHGTYVDASINGQVTETYLCDAVFDTWLTEKVIVDTETGTLTYFLNNELVTTATIAGLTSLDVSYYTIKFWPYGWWTGHYHYMDYININTENSYIVSVAANPSDGGTVTGGGSYQDGQTCTVTATANGGYTFTNWTENGTEVSTDASYTFTVTGDRTLVANFAEGSSECPIVFDLYDSYGDGWTGNKLVVSYNGSEYAEITLESGSSGTQTLMIEDGSHVTLTWIEGNWMGECSFSVNYSNGSMIYYGSNLSGSFVYEFDVDCIGTPASTCDVVVSANITAGGTVSGGGEYAYGFTCTVMAMANTGYTFMYWTENGQHVSSEASYSFIVTGGRNLVAVFSETNGSGLLSGTFTVGENVQVHFSKGNLLYQASTGTWRFAENQYDCMSSGNVNTSSTYSGWIDLYCWGTSGWDSGAQEFQPYATSTSNDSYLTGGSSSINLTGDYADADWAYHNAIVNGGQQSGLWRCLTHEEYIYMIESRADASQKYAYANVNGINGLVILPDTWTLPDGLSFVPQAGSWTSNVYSAEQWIQMESAGAVFLPATGTRQGNSVFYVGGLGDYWSSTACDESTGHSMSFFNGNVYPGDTRYRCLGTSVRPVQVIQYASFTIQTSANPTEGGTVIGGGIYQQGQACTLTATPNEGYIFTDWTENGTQVSTDASYTFTVTGDRTLVANFTAVPSGYHWEVNVYQYPNTMTVTGIIQINGVEQATNMLELGAFCNEECRGREKLSYVTGLDRYLLFLNLHGDNGDVFTFRLYDHALGQELDLICINSVTFTTNGVLGTATDPYVFSFIDPVQGVQFTSLPEGWTWWSSYVEQNGIDGLGQMETSLGGNGIMIKSQSNGFVSNYGDFWVGLLSSINNESTYFIQTNAACEMTVTGNLTQASSHPITLSTGWTWIGYPCPTAMSVNTAMSNLTPVENDMLKAQEGFAVYYPNIGWLGGLQTLAPGMGLMFESHNTSTVTLTYPDAARTENLAENITARDNHWKPDVQAYPDNMSVMAIVELDGVELQSDRFELATFANGECRGSAKLMYVEPLNRYMAFMTVYGDDAAELSFGLYDASTDTETYESLDRLFFEANAVVGSINVPFVVSFRGMTGMDEFDTHIHLFPNPVDKGQAFSIGLSTEEVGAVRVDIVNALGVVLSTKTSTRLPASLKAPSASGVYMLKITVEGKGTFYRRLIVR